MNEILEIREKYDKLVSWTSELITERDNVYKYILQYKNKCIKLENELKQSESEYKSLIAQNKEENVLLLIFR